MKSIFGDIDNLIEQAVATATGTEKQLQKKQVSAVEKRGVKAEKQVKEEEVEEADEEEKSSDDESAKKIKGKPPEEKVSQKSAEKKPADEIPGTKTSKKLDDPSEKTIVDPKFDDISNKVNALRGSGSLRDEKVSSAVKSYLNTLTPAEKSALLTYLTNLAQIMASVKSPKDVKDPGKMGIKIAFKKGTKDAISQKPEKSGNNEPSDVVVVGGK